MPQGAVVDPVETYAQKRRMDTREHKGTAFGMRRLAGMLLFCALLLRGVIPGGYMPNFDAADGQGFLVICSAVGERLLPVDGGGPVPADTHQDGLCAFALLSGLTPLLLLAVLLLWWPPRAVRRPLLPVLRNLFQIICRPPEARAPPAFA